MRRTVPAKRGQGKGYTLGSHPLLTSATQKAMSTHLECRHMTKCKSRLARCSMPPIEVRRSRNLLPIVTNVSLTTLPLASGRPFARNTSHRFPTYRRPYLQPYLDSNQALASSNQDPAIATRVTIVIPGSPPKCRRAQRLALRSAQMSTTPDKAKATARYAGLAPAVPRKKHRRAKRIPITDPPMRKGIVPTPTIPSKHTIPMTCQDGTCDSLQADDAGVSTLSSSQTLEELVPIPKPQQTRPALGSPEETGFRRDRNPRRCQLEGMPGPQDISILLLPFAYVPCPV